MCDRPWPRVRAHYRLIAAIIAAVVLGATPGAASGEAAANGSPAVLYRVFLKDGGVLVSYGEFARVADRVVLSIPIGGTDVSPVLHVISIAETAVEWQRTNAYAQAARARHYAETQGESDFARLTREVSDTLYKVGSTDDAARRLALAESARQQLVEWPQTHFGYKGEELQQMTTWLDQVVSELRVAAGQKSFDLALVANATIPAVPAVDLLPAPTFRDRLENGLVGRAAHHGYATAGVDPALDSRRACAGGRTGVRRTAGWRSSDRAPPPSWRSSSSTIATTRNSPVARSREPRSSNAALTCDRSRASSAGCWTRTYACSAPGPPTWLRSWPRST